VPILEPSPESKIRIKELLSMIETRGDLREIVLAVNANPEGENTGDYVKKMLAPLALKHNIKISMLGRGLSTGTELEYSDAETLKNALKNRQ
jgi:recombination protein RecR